MYFFILMDNLVYIATLIICLATIPWQSLNQTLKYRQKCNRHCLLICVAWYVCTYSRYNINYIHDEHNTTAVDQSS